MEKEKLSQSVIAYLKSRPFADIVKDFEHYNKPPKGCGYTEWMTALKKLEKNGDDLAGEIISSLLYFQIHEPVIMQEIGIAEMNEYGLGWNASTLDVEKLKHFMRYTFQSDKQLLRTFGIKKPKEFNWALYGLDVEGFDMRKAFNEYDKYFN